MTVLHQFSNLRSCDYAFFYHGIMYTRTYLSQVFDHALFVHFLRKVCCEEVTGSTSGLRKINFGLVPNICQVASPFLHYDNFLDNCPTHKWSKSTRYIRAVNQDKQPQLSDHHVCSNYACCTCMDFNNRSILAYVSNSCEQHVLRVLMDKYWRYV